jgi:putative membrane-bound dehydrogenase-like protein
VDVDGDGDQDVITSLAAHGYGVAWFEQVREGEQISFRQHLIAGARPAETEFGVVFSQPHALAIADIDGDGLVDIVTGKRPWAHGPHGDAEPMAAPVIYWFRCVRDAEQGVRFEPQLVSDDSGVGVDVVIDDVNGDGWLDIVSANKRGVFIHRQDRRPVEPDQQKRMQLTKAKDAAQPLPAARRPESGLSPLEAVRQFTAPRGFHVDLIAGEPDLHQPIAFCFDARGRLWIAEAHTYPQRAPEGQGRDIIRILEDVDGDGRYESNKVFTEGLNLVSGIEVGFGGVWVGAAPYLLFIPDRDGDDIPDSQPEVLLDGFGYQDTHETLNAFTWGPDGWLYGCQGVFTHSLVGKPGATKEERTPLNAAVWRYHPTRHQFEIFANGTSNPWGVTFDARGQAFITACVIPHAYHIIQGGRYQRQAGQHFDPYTFDDIKTIADHAHYAGNIADHAWWGRDEAVEDDATSTAGGGHAHCGAVIYYGDNWPVEYRGALLMHNLHGNRINVDLLRADGSGFIASHGRDLLYANDPWFRGINFQVGPDGALYLIDWYDRNACHRNTPEIWDRTNGRAYRLRFGDLQPRLEDLTQASNERLVELQSHANQWHVVQARKVLAERASAGQEMTAIREKLMVITSRAVATEERLKHLWAAHGIAPLNANESLKLLADANPAIRAWAIQLACEVGTPTTQLVERMVEMANNETSAIVRLYLAAALQRITNGNVNANQRFAIAQGLVSHSDSQHDKNLPLLIWYGVSPLIGENPERAFAVLVQSNAIPLVRQYAVRRMASDPQLVPTLVAFLAEKADDTLLKLALNELAGSAAKLGKIDMPPQWPQLVARTSNSADADVRRAVQTLSVSFGDASVFPLLRDTVKDSEADIALRREALATLSRGRDPQLESLALSMLDDRSLQGELLEILGRFDSPAIPLRIVALFPSLDANLQRTAIDTLASRVTHARALLDAVAAEEIPRTSMTALHASKIRQLNDKELQNRLTELWGVVGGTPEETAKEIASLKKQLTAASLIKANPSQGRALYEKSCGQCHRLFGSGSDIGPDLTGSNRANLDYLLENILAPNAIVGKDYQAVSVLTLDGRVITGLVKEQSDAAIVLHDAEKLVTIPRSEIEEITDTVRSVMPEGILKPFSGDQVADLIAYLQSPAQVPLAVATPEWNAKGALPNAIEVEHIVENISVTSGNVASQGMSGFSQGKWSGNDQAWWTGGKEGATLSIPIQVTEDGRYSVAIAFTKAPDYAIIRVSVDGKPATETIDLFAPGRVTSTGPLLIDTLPLAAGQHTITCEIVGHHPQAVPARMVGIDYIYLQPASP